MSTEKSNPEKRINKKKRLIGDVVSDKMDKTVVVNVIQTFTDQRYGKVMRKNRKFSVHDEENLAKTGDKVEIIECRPYSKNKRWRLLKIVREKVSIETKPEEKNIEKK